MRAMKASEAVGRRFRVAHLDDDAYQGWAEKTGECVEVSCYTPRNPVIIDLPDTGERCFSWRELELAEDES